MQLFALIAVFGSIIVLVQAGGGNTTTQSENCTIPCMDAVFVLDISISIGNDTNFNLMKDFVKNTSYLMNISVECSHAAVILFARDATIRFDLNEYTDETKLTKAINEIVYSELSKQKGKKSVHKGTNTPAALDLLKNASLDGRLGLRDDFVHIGVVITDGRPNLNHLKFKLNESSELTETAGKRLHEAKIYDQIYAIGIKGNKPLGNNTLKFIADPEELVFSIAGFDEELFAELKRNISRQFCNPCLLQQCPSGAECKICNETNGTYCEYSCAIDNGGCPEGSQCAEVIVPTCNPGPCCSCVNVICSVTVPPCPTPCMDAVFVLDVSKSIKNEENFRRMKDFVFRTFSLVNISLECSHAALIVFGAGARIEFDLYNYTDLDSLRNAIYNKTFQDFQDLHDEVGTDTPEALRLMGQKNELHFRPGGLPRVGIVLTDGRPNLNHRDIKKQDAKDMTRDAGKVLHDSGLYDQIYAIGIQGSDRNPIKPNTLKAIAYNTNLLFISNLTDESFEMAGRIFAREFCNRTACTNYTCSTGSKCKVCEKNGDPHCDYSCEIDNGGCPEAKRCELEYGVCAPENCCSPTVKCVEPPCDLPCMDAVFVLDASRSIRDESNFKLMKDFVSSTFSLVNISAECSRAALILFAEEAQIMFNLSQYADVTSLRNALYEITCYICYVTLLAYEKSL